MIGLFRYLWDSWRLLWQDWTHKTIELPENKPLWEEVAIEVIESSPGPDLDAHKVLIVPDVYPADLDNPKTKFIELPPFEALVGLKYANLEVAGCYVKASEGLGWGAANEDWFVRSWRRMAEVGLKHRGAYHFLRFQSSGMAQADYFLRIIDKAGGWDGNELMPMVDVEEGGQGSWASMKLEKVDHQTRYRLAAQVTNCVSTFVERVKMKTGKRVCVYGRGVFRDLQMTGCLFGADSVCNPAYTKQMPRMEAYGVPLEKVSLWQLCGDGYVVADGYPSSIPGWGATDYSVHLNADKTTSWRTFYEKCLAKQP
jgi:GH25 family lysozyme M1 (1,4-beta-N-acetylmuramidase)